ncbi:LysR family transcriptional regulator [Rhodocista pekingensis]|uniref:LysR family transcriptional regulator n=1 Tax=Rhodocista pekingensis TaxID=201185 RepID=A0ABW2L1Q1_9PROT
MNLRQLQHFVALAETGSVRRTSARLNLSQPALSKSIRALEEDLGVVLFDRLPRGLRLTPVGTWLLSRSVPLLAEARQLRNEIELIRRQTGSEVRIAAGTVLCASLIPRSLARLREVAPSIRGIVSAGYWDDQKTMLLNAEIDFLVADARDLEDIAEFELARLPVEPICAFARPGHPLAGRRGLTPADLRGFDAAGLTRLPKGLERVLRDLPDLPVGGGSAVGSDDFGLLRTVAAASDLLLFAPPGAVSDQTGRGELVRLDLSLPVEVQTHFAIVWRRDRGLSPSAELLKRTILECAALPPPVSPSPAAAARGPRSAPAATAETA